MLTGLVQNAAAENLTDNFNAIKKALNRLTRCDLVILPEVFLYRGNPSALADVFRYYQHTVRPFLAAFSRKHRLTIVAGSVLVPATKGKFTNTTEVLVNGRVKTRYDKIHLFRIDTGRKKIDESDHMVEGRRPVSFSLGRWHIGLGICFDLRFPELFRAYARKSVGVTATSSGPVDCIIIPSNFLKETGRKHWQVLLRARAIENQCYVIGVNQSGIHPRLNVASYGHSLVVNPDGAVIAELGDRPGVKTVKLDRRELRRSRGRLCSAPIAQAADFLL
jgi:nitrilase